MKEMILKYPKVAKEIWQIVFAAYVPKFDYDKYPELVTVLDNVSKDFIKDYPEKMMICSNDKYVQLDRHFVSQFVVFRRAFYLRT